MTVSIAVALALAIAGVWMVAGTSVARASEITAQELQALVQDTTGPGLLGEGYLAHGGGPGGFFRGGIDYQQLLADALGISVGDLQAAYEKARVAAIEAAVQEGLLTQEQADEMTVWGGMWGKAFSFLGGRHAKPDVPGGAIDEEALLAAALQISVEELQQAREKANQAAIDAAVAEGLITQEQADEMAARRTLQTYLDRDALLATALGMTQEQLGQAYADGKTLTDLLAAQNLDAATVRERLTEAYGAALDQAVADGVITQEQRDEMAQGRGMPFLGERGWMPFLGDRERMPFGGEREELPFGGGRGGMRGHRDFRGAPPEWNDEDDGTGSGTGLRRPGRTLDTDSAL